jgi:hypothetical protein
MLGILINFRMTSFQLENLAAVTYEFFESHIRFKDWSRNTIIVVFWDVETRKVDYVFKTRGGEPPSKIYPAEESGMLFREVSLQIMTLQLDLHN